MKSSPTYSAESSPFKCVRVKPGMTIDLSSCEKRGETSFISVSGSLGSVLLCQEDELRKRHQWKVNDKGMTGHHRRPPVGHRRRRENPSYYFGRFLGASSLINHSQSRVMTFPSSASTSSCFFLSKIYR